jgi:hypothetical protein
MNTNLQLETERLTRSWMQYDESLLGGYLVAGVEDPRTNLQSLLTRNYLITALFGSKYSELLDQEFRFALAMNWLLKLLPPTGDEDDLATVRHALEHRCDNAEDIPIPVLIQDTYAALPVQLNGIQLPNYIEEFLTTTPPATGMTPPILGTFERLWNGLLASEPRQIVSLLEPACGSANDYRSFDSFGLAPFLDYSGFDLCEKNVINARALFPEIRFETGNAFAIQAADKQFDHCIVHDLFEHLSIEGMETAVSEICRVTKRGICASFFQMDETPEHLVRPVDDYHWNKLSMARTKALFEPHASAVRVVHLDTLARLEFNLGTTHNPDAYTFTVSL